MASAVYRAITENKHLIAEAGTGVGKSLAYLIPSAFWAAANKKKVIVATYTKALQEQLYKKDLPIVQSALKQAGMPFKYFLLMGSANYLCLSRLRRSIKYGPDLFDAEEFKRAADKLLEWADNAGSGRRQEIPFRTPHNIWESVCRDTEMCLGKKCGLRAACLYQKEVSLAKQADILIANQHLFFAGIPVPAFDAVIFDEAQNLEEVASDFLGFSFTNKQLKRFLDDIYNRKSGRGLVKTLKNQPAGWQEEIRQAVDDVHFSARIFFQDILNKSGFDGFGAQRSKTKRIREANIAPDNLSEPLHELAGALSETAGRIQTPEEEAEIKAYMNRCLLMTGHLKAFMQCDSKEHSYWIETAVSGRNPHISLNMAPVDISTALKQELFDKNRPVILTSATMAVNGSFAMIKSRLGLEQNLETLLDSPFDYEKQAVIYIADDIPDPKDGEEYEKAVIERCPEIFRIIKNGIFVLFTSWRLLERSSHAFSGVADGRPVLKQGDDTPDRLLNEFKARGNAILLATDTFWQGVDVQGPALSCVIITRLPFLSPDSPLEEARIEWLSAKGIDSFTEYTLPKAVVKFRQGFGRLIRSRTDSGAVVILDPRIITRPYGAMFLRSVPKCGQAGSLDELKRFFAKTADTLPAAG